MGREEEEEKGEEATQQNLIETLCGLFLFFLSRSFLPSSQSHFEFTSDPRGNWEKRTRSGGVGGGT